MKRSLVSIHDVMPSTLDLVTELIDRCEQQGVDVITLLVVPGCDWTEQQVRQLRGWVDKGHELAGHGWIHRCESINGFWHRLHSLTISRSVAEHLCLSANQIHDLIHRCQQWFAEQQLPRPALYVPPAWALGSISADQLREVPFTMIETISGIRWTQSNRITRLPLVGFEADTITRRLGLSASNWLSGRYAHWSGKPTRIAIHPHDHRLRLQHQLESTLRQPFQSISYSSLA